MSTSKHASSPKHSPTAKRGTHRGRRHAELLEPRRLLATIYGVVFDDANDNTVRDAGEAGLAGWVVQLDINNNGSIDRTTTSSSTGGYCFDSVSSGCHVVRIVQQSGWRVTTPPGGSYTVYFASYSSSASVNFGETQRSAISGTVFEDRNVNGVRNAGEPVLTNRRVYLDADDDAVYDDGEPTALSDGSGRYIIRNLDPWMTWTERLVTRTGYVASDNVVTTQPGAEVVADVAEIRALGAPSNLQGLYGSGCSDVTLTWTDNSQVEQGFTIEQSTNGGAFTQIDTVGPDVTSHTVTGLTAGSASYRFRVAAYDANGNSYYSNIAYPGALGPPQNIRSVVQAGRVELYWDPPAGADASTTYSIYRSTVEGDPGSLRASGITGTSWVDTAVTNGATYYYSVVAVAPAHCGTGTVPSPDSENVGGDVPTINGIRYVRVRFNIALGLIVRMPGVPSDTVGADRRLYSSAPPENLISEVARLRDRARFSYSSNSTTYGVGFEAGYYMGPDQDVPPGPWGAGVRHSGSGPRNAGTVGGAFLRWNNGTWGDVPVGNPDNPFNVYAKISAWVSSGQGDPPLFGWWAEIAGSYRGIYEVKYEYQTGGALQAAPPSPSWSPSLTASSTAASPGGLSDDKDDEDDEQEDPLALRAT